MARQRAPTASAAQLGRLGRAIRDARDARRLTQRAFAEKISVSPRFLAMLEGGADVSVGRLAEIAARLGVSASALLDGEDAAALPLRDAIYARLRGRSTVELARVLTAIHTVVDTGTRVALLGIRGAGKTTVGGKLALLLDVPFVELDTRIERVAGMSIGSVFELHGEAHYRALERGALDALLAEGPSFVVATGGGIVTDAEEYALLRRACSTVWLRATPEEHWQRVVAQGDARPMRENPRAMDELRALFAARAPLYGEAQLVVETSGRTIAEVAKEIAARVKAR
jgi:XRE family aerobic/anaerobic benzoate catabolism transcriptional regulator